MEEIRKNEFWTFDLLSQFDKNAINYYKFQQYLLWFLSLISIIILGVTSYSPSEYICNSDWSSSVKRSCKIMYFFYAFCNIYIGIIIETFTLYMALHSQFQVKIICSYIRSEFQNYDNLPFNYKIYSKFYQKTAREILVRCIQQYQILNK